MKKLKKIKHKTKKALIKRIKITGTGKIMRSHQLRSGHLRRNKSKRTLRRHAKATPVSKTALKSIKRMLGI
ncbi:50S ribosomal protein L35 [Candidatus Daviesbacteria bacterium]|nr:50S ribosomal protein L35 [Candidatus Daviesbacteria bacterium]